MLRHHCTEFQSSFTDTTITNLWSMNWQCYGTTALNFRVASQTLQTSEVWTGNAMVPLHWTSTDKRKIKLNLGYYMSCVGCTKGTNYLLGNNSLAIYIYTPHLLAFLVSFELVQGFQMNLHLTHKHHLFSSLCLSQCLSVCFSLCLSLPVTVCLSVSLVRFFFG